MSQDPGAISSPSDTYLTPVSSSSALSPSANTSEFYSAISSEEGEEYFDLKEDEDLAGLEIQPQILHGSDVVLELFRIVDDLCTGTEDDQADALKLLKEQEEDVGDISWNLYNVFCDITLKQLYKKHNSYFAGLCFAKLIIFKVQKSWVL